MRRTEFEITKMDCPSEENLIRLKLQELTDIQHLDFDIANRKLTVHHLGSHHVIEQSIAELKLGSSLLSSNESEQTEFKEEADQRTLLWTVLLINFAFFIIEITTGLISNSMGLVADSLDMLADAFVYGISLLAVGGSVVRKKKIASLAGYFQITLAIIGFIEVLRRFFGIEKMPNFSTMIMVSILALIANGVSLYLMQQSKSKEEAHIKASLIFTSNDVIINLGVILAALLVYFTQSAMPDLLIGTLVFILVIRGALSILKLGRSGKYEV